MRVDPRWVARMPVAAITLLWLLLWAGSLPAPNIDDLWFLGPAVSLASGSGLANPWLAPWLFAHFGSDEYLIHAPLASYVSAGMLRLTGISASSVVGYQCALGMLLSVGVWTLLRPLGVKWWGLCIAVAAAAGFVLTRGSRPDALAALLLVLSAHAFNRPGYAGWTLGCLGLALAPLALPIAASLSMPVFIAALWLHEPRLRGEPIARRVALAAAAIAVAMLLGLWMIDFRTRPFAEMFLKTAAMRTAPLGDQWRSFVSQLFVGREPVLTLPLWIAFVALSIHGGFHRRDRRPVALAAFLFVSSFVLGLLMYAQYAAILLKPTLAIVGIAAFCTARGTRLERAAGALFAAIVLLGWLPVWVQAVVGGPESPQYYERALARVRTLPHARVLVDATAARHVFDYRLPAGAQDWVSTRLVDHGMTTLVAAKPSGEVWVVADGQTLAWCVPDSGAKPDYMRIAGRALQSLQLHPRRVYIFP